MEGAISSRPNTRVAVVTGGNKGIGFEVCRQLASDGEVTVVLTARDETRGTEAVEKLRALGLTDDDVVFHQLDITDESSIASLGDFLKTRFGKLDILVNNAAIAGVEYPQDVDTNEEKFAGMDTKQRLEWMIKTVREPIDAAKKAVETNYYGTKHVTQALLPLLLQSSSSSQGKIVCVSSDYGLLKLIGDEEVRRDLDDIDNLTEERVDEVLHKFLSDFEAGALEGRGWPAGFSASKVTLVATNAFARIMARRHPTLALRVNCADPGYVKTDMTMGSGVLTPEEGACSVVGVALLPDGGPTGKYFTKGREASFV
ncbi:(+)-neomenthol dehydrogenase-like isoform X2 [Triticum dicoccoides]|uniref:(+)-neomenthol dehydrogenase-like isoform X2 n=1 Tax=Triticum dicoccoides TaxID=85692 RepID=UPI000E789A7F|nr:(+)-neomenthol dehydrogenase-like isoform X2 [Triticum dicoccoides]